MSKRGTFSQAEPELTEINISPMIDMVFILLIFFIVTTVFVEEPGVEVRRPPALSAEDLQKNSLLFAITPAGDVVYGGRNVGLAGIRSIVARFSRKDPMPVILQVDENAPAQVAVRAVDEAKFGGAHQVFYSTRR